jgi:ribonuclease BN (tRNA processing enzyme)
VSVRLTFVGSGDAFAAGGRFQTCFQLDADGEEPLLLDCGASALIALKRLDIDPAGIGHVALTHLHGDHFGGLPWLILDGQFAKRTKPLAILGPPGTRERFHQAFDALYPGAKDTERPFETVVHEYTERTGQDFGPARITAYPVIHSPATMPHGLRVEYGGKVIAYSGDTEWTDTLIDLAHGADLFVCECNFFDKKAPGHLDYHTLIEHRPQLNCDRVVLTHMGDDMLARIGDLDVDAATDGAVIDI